MRGVASEGFNVVHLEASEGFNVDNLGGQVHTITVTSGGTAIEPGFVEADYVRGLRGEEGGDPPNSTPLGIDTTQVNEYACV